MSDLINRQGAIKQFCNQCKGQNEPCEHRQSCKTMKVLEALPSAGPETGMWMEVIAKNKNTGEVRECRQCSECGARYIRRYGADRGVEESQPKFCPNCGAMMYKGGDSE